MMGLGMGVGVQREQKGRENINMAVVMWLLHILILLQNLIPF
jgi:hypothetical protein